MFKYPGVVTERFDDAKFNVNYCLFFIKKYLKKDILEVGAGCGTFTDQYFNNKIKSITLTELDQKNFIFLKKKFKKKNLFIYKKKINKIKKKYNTIIYLHVLEHIKNDLQEIKEATNKLKKNGHLIFLVPAHQKMYTNLDKLVGHFRRYEPSFFKKKFKNLKKINFKFLDSMGLILYFLNKLFFKNENFPSRLKIFIWDKLFIPLSMILDFFTFYKLGKCMLITYKKV